MNFLKYSATFFPFPCEVTDGELANAVTFNTQLASKEVDNDYAGKQNLEDVAAVSGPFVSNLQKEVNGLGSFSGRTAGSVFNSLPIWTNNDVGLSTDDLKVRDEALTLAFNTSAGHAHDGTTGAGANIDASDLDAFNNFMAALQTFTKTAASGTSTVVTTELTGKTPGGTSTSVGVYTTAPDNRVQLLSLPSETGIEDANGQAVYGRITEAAGIWTLSFFTNEAGVETAHSLSSQDIRIYFSEVFTMGTRPTRGADTGMLPSLDLTADIADATTTQRGLMSTGVQSFAGAKTFTGAISASNLSGTNTGDVTLAVIGAVPNANAASITGQVLNLQPADATFGGVVTAIAQTLAGLKTFAAGLVAQTIARFEGWLESDTVNDTSSGSAVTLAEQTKHVVRLTNAALVSITGVTAPTNTKVRHQILINRTGVSITILNDAGTAANRILTGTAANMSMLADSAIWIAYDTVTAKWQIVGGSGGSTSPLTTKGDIYTYSTSDTRLPVGTNGQALLSDSATATGLRWGDSGSFTVFATASISAAATITAAASQREIRRVQGNAAAVTANTTTPITAGTTEGQELILKGISDTNTVTITNSGNVTLNGDMVLYASSTLSLVWIDSKWLEIARKI